MSLFKYKKPQQVHTVAKNKFCNTANSAICKSKQSFDGKAGEVSKKLHLNSIYLQSLVLNGKLFTGTR